MKFYKDENGALCAEDHGELDILADFLETDVQGDRTAAIDLLQYLEKKDGQRIGNAFEVTFSDTHVTLTALEGEPQSQQISRVIFFQAVEAWIVFIGD